MVSPTLERDLKKKRTTTLQLLARTTNLLSKPGQQFLVHPRYVRKVDDVPLKPISEGFLVSRSIVGTAVMFH